MGKVEINIPELELKRMNYHLGSLSGWVSRCGYKELGLEDLEVTVELFEGDRFLLYFKIKYNGEWFKPLTGVITKFADVLDAVKTDLKNKIRVLSILKQIQKQTNGKRS